MSNAQQDTNPENNWPDLIKHAQDAEGDRIAGFMELYIKHHPDTNPEHYSDMADIIRDAIERIDNVRLGRPQNHSELQANMKMGTRIRIKGDLPSTTTTVSTFEQINNGPGQAR